MTATRRHLLDYLDRLNVGHRTHDHPPVFTVAESSAIKCEMPGGHTKNLFLKDKRGRLFLLCALTETKIDLTALARLLSAGRFSFGAPDLLLQALGVTPGSVTVFGLMNDALGRVTLLLDEALFSLDPVNFHPLTNDATTAISGAGLMTFLNATGHRPMHIAFSPDGAPRLVEPAPATAHLAGDMASVAKDER